MQSSNPTRPVGEAPLRPPRPFSPTARAWLFLTPSLCFLIVLIAASLLVLRMSIGEKGAEWTGFSLASYAQLLQPYYLKSLLLTLRLAFVSALIAVLLAIPGGYSMARLQSPLLRRIFLAAELLPLSPKPASGSLSDLADDGLLPLLPEAAAWPPWPGWPSPDEP